MTPPRPSILRSALAAMSVRIVVLQIVLAALVFLLTVFWLRLPDSSALSVAATILIGLFLLAFASGGEIALMLWVCNLPRTRARVLKGALFMLVAVALWFVWSWLIETVQSKDEMFAGYLNSRFSASLRNTFSYTHIYRTFECIALVLQWIGAGILAAGVCAAAAGARPARAIRRTLFSATYWVVLVIGSLAASALTSLLMNWTPGHTLSVQLLSLAVRLTIVTVVDAVIAVFILAVIAVCIRLSNSSYETPAGIPDNNQPFTAETP